MNTNQSILMMLWYNEACRWLSLKHIIYETNLIKDRTECFDDHFPRKKISCNREHVSKQLDQGICFVSTYTHR